MQIKQFASTNGSVFRRSRVPAVVYVTAIIVVKGNIVRVLLALGCFLGEATGGLGPSTYHRDHPAMTEERTDRGSRSELLTLDPCTGLLIAETAYGVVDISRKSGGGGEGPGRSSEQARDSEKRKKRKKADIQTHFFDPNCFRCE